MVIGVCGFFLEWVLVFASYGVCGVGIFVRLRIFVENKELRIPELRFPLGSLD